MGLLVEQNMISPKRGSKFFLNMISTRKLTSFSSKINTISSFGFGVSIFFFTFSFHTSSCFLSSISPRAPKLPPIEAIQNTLFVNYLIVSSPSITKLDYCNVFIRVLLLTSREHITSQV